MRTDREELELWRRVKKEEEKKFVYAILVWIRVSHSTPVYRQ